MKFKNIKIVISVIFLLLIFFYKAYLTQPPQARQSLNAQNNADNQTHTSALSTAILAHQTVKYIEVKNVQVIKLLKQDNYGSRHQKWKVRVSPTQELTAVYNIDLAEKIPLKVGDTISMAGELVYDDRSGAPILHWIHEDPRGRRKNGYVQLNDKIYGYLNKN